MIARMHHKVWKQVCKWLDQTLYIPCSNMSSPFTTKCQDATGNGDVEGKRQVLHKLFDPRLEYFGGQGKVRLDIAVDLVELDGGTRPKL